MKIFEIISKYKTYIIIASIIVASGISVYIQSRKERGCNQWASN